MQTLTLETPDVDLVYDVHGPLPTDGGRPPLVMIGQPMCAEGFTTLASYFPDRTVVAYDVRGLGRSVRKDGRVDHTPQDNAADVHAIIEALGGGPVELLGSSGGAVTALELVTRSPRRRERRRGARAADPGRAARRRQRPGGAGRRRGALPRGRSVAPGWPRSSR